jgi:hypothetical protein
MAGDPKNIQPAGGSGGGTAVALQDEAFKQGYASGYYDTQGNVRSPSTFTAQMMEKLFHCRLPETKEEYDEFYTMVPTVIAALPRIPNISQIDYNRVVRVWHDIREMSASEGAERVVASDIMQLIFELRLLVARGDTALPGITGVSAIITTRQVGEQTVKMPQQKESSGGFFGFLRGKG